MEAVVGEEQKGLRLDVAVATAMPQLSRAFVQKLSAQGHVLVNGQSVKAGYKLKIGDKLLVNYEEQSIDDIPVVELPIIYEDDNCIVINKPAGILTHAQSRHINEPTVASFLRSRLPKSDNEWGSGERIGIVHRLDRATSGVIICAKNQDALTYLQKQFAKRRVVKKYIAVVEGRPAQPEAVIDMPIERNPKAPATFRVGINGKQSITRYKVLHEGQSRSLLLLTPQTGRTHQLRVHMAQLGQPIVGDPLYGSGKFGDRLFLHALSLEITLPNDEPRTFEAPLPLDFQTEAEA